MNINKNITIKLLLDSYPEVAQVFIRRGLACVGCYGEEFHTVEEVARIYEIDVQEFTQQLIKAATKGSKAQNQNTI